MDSFLAPPPPLPPPPPGEAARLELLKHLQILDTPPEQVYDDIARLASQICGTPIASITLLDDERMWLKSAVGLPCGSHPREVSFCRHAIVSPEPMLIVEDAAADPRFWDNPLVTGQPHIRFYAGATIRMPGGEALGTVCAIDTEPRRLSADQYEALGALSRQVTSLLQLRQQTEAARRDAAALQQVLGEAREERRRSAELLEIVLRGGNLGLWELHVPSGRSTANARERELIGLAPDASIDRLDWRELIHPDDWPAVQAASDAHRRGDTDRQLCEHRLRHVDGHWVWVLSSAVIVERDAAGETVRIIGTHKDISEGVTGRETLEQMTSLLERTGSMAQVGGWELEPASGRVGFTKEVYAIHDLPRDVEPHLVEALSFYPQPGRQQLAAALERAVSHGEVYDLELPFVTATGRELYVRTRSEVERENGVTVRVFGTFQDITAKKTAELAAAESQRRLRLVTDHMPALIAYVDADSRYGFVNAHSLTLLGEDFRSAIGRTVREARGENVYRQIEPWMNAALRGEKVEFSYVEPRFGEDRHWKTSYIPDLDEGGAVQGFYAMSVDITEQHRIQTQLESLARIDALTGLPNRRQFDEQIGEALQRARRQQRPLAVMFLDVDHFKSINDALGHAGGDSVLREFGRRLREQLRSTDMVARVSGDEFVVVCEAAGERLAVEHLAAKIVDRIRQPFELPEGALRVTTSIGIAIGSGNDDAAGLLARADGALYEAKRAGRGRYAIATH